MNIFDKKGRNYVYVSRKPDQLDQKTKKCQYFQTDAIYGKSTCMKKVISIYLSLPLDIDPRTPVESVQSSLETSAVSGPGSSYTWTSLVKAHKRSSPEAQIHPYWPAE